MNRNRTTASRVDRLREKLSEANLDAILVVDQANRRYLSGFTGSTGWLFISQKEALLITDGRYWERAEREAPAFTLVRVSPDRGYEKTLHQILSERPGRIGFEAERVTVSQYERILRRSPAVSWTPADGILDDLRSVKEPVELAAIRKAAAITDLAMQHVPEMLRPGITEAELAWELEKLMREHGAEGVAFSPLVAFGTTSAQPHAETGDTQLAPEMAVCIDVGARVDGYCADLTRSFWYGTSPDKTYLRAWAAVREAQVAAMAVLRPGITCRMVDAVARDTLRRHGLADAFTHSLGHGVGLNIHEKPHLNRLTLSPLAAGNVVTIEPGVYLAGSWGIRLEELAVIWDNGPEVISRAPRWRVIKNR